MCLKWGGGGVDSVNLNYLAALEGDKVRATNCYSMQSSCRVPSLECKRAEHITMLLLLPLLLLLSNRWRRANGKEEEGNAAIRIIYQFKV